MSPAMAGAGWYVKFESWLFPPINSCRARHSDRIACSARSWEICPPALARRLRCARTCGDAGRLACPTLSGLRARGCRADAGGPGEFRAGGGGWIVDSMPLRAGRDAQLLAQVAHASRIPIVCPTGVHLEKYYPPDHPLLALNRDELYDCFRKEIEVGMDDGSGLLPLRAGVIKVASDGGPLSAAERERFAAAALASQQTGCPLLTHTAGGAEAFAQVACLTAQGANPAKIVLSHCDRNGNLNFHRDLLHTGVALEYDQHFRQLLRGEVCQAVQLLPQLAAEFPGQLLLGMDLARQKLLARHWRSTRTGLVGRRVATVTAANRHYQTSAPANNHRQRARLLFLGILLRITLGHEFSSPPHQCHRQLPVPRLAGIRRAAFERVRLRRSCANCKRTPTVAAVRDQVAAGLDVITDGEQGRLDFNLSFYGYLEGIELESAPPRRWGPPAHDQRGKHEIVGRTGRAARARRRRRVSSGCRKWPPTSLRQASRSKPASPDRSRCRAGCNPNRQYPDRYAHHRSIAAAGAR